MYAIVNKIDRLFYTREVGKGRRQIEQEKHKSRGVWRKN